MFLGGVPVLLADAAADASLRALPANPALVLVEGVGALVRTGLAVGGEEMAACLGLVLARLNQEAPLVVLSAAEEAELLGWDAEHYRRALNVTAS